MGKESNTSLQKWVSGVATSLICIGIPSLIGFCFHFSGRVAVLEYKTDDIRARFNEHIHEGEPWHLSRDSAPPAFAR